MAPMLTALLLSSAAAVFAVDVAFNEVDFDFFGNDFASWNPPSGLIPVDAMAQCFSKCTDPLGGFSPRCKAVTYFAGTCYFKEAHGEATYKQGTISSGVYASLAVANAEICPATIEKNTDYQDNDLTNVKGTSLECCEICRKTPKCRAYSWSNHNEGTCWLKSKRGTKITKNGVESAIVYPPSVPGPSPTVEEDIDYVDHDIGNKHSTTYGGCFDLCSSFGGCGAFSWSKHNGGTCWLKTKKDQPIWNAGVYSAVVNPTPATCEAASKFVNTDITGNDMGSKNGIPNPDDCPAFCKATTGCLGFAWSGYMGGTCWLKSAVAPTGFNAGVTACTKIL